MYNIKLPLTDKFLWDLYNLIEKIDKTFDLFAPRTMKEVWYPDLYKLRRKYDRKKTGRYFSQFISYLKRKNYIKVKNLRQKEGVIITKKGMGRILRTRLKKFEKKRRSDKKWQMIIFDIPENKRDLRDLLRENLQFLGYEMLQQSVWVCPYDVLKETEKIIRQYLLDSYVKLFLIEELETLCL